MQRHIEAVHEGFKYPCSQCDFKSSGKANLKKHMQLVHQGVRYPCDQYQLKATSEA